MFDWKSVLVGIAPTIGTLITGGNPVGGMGLSRIATALLGKSDASEEEISKAIEGADQETLLKIKQIDADFKTDMLKLHVDLSKSEIADTQDARKREIATGDSTTKQLAGVVVGGFFTVLGLICFVEIPPDTQQPVNILLGSLTALVIQVGNYYFGSSKGSKEKTELLGRFAEND